MDTAALTANVALADDARHEGGRLLALAGREGLRAIERREGQATVHPSSLLHGVSRMMRGSRYSLICFFRSLAAEDEERQQWHADSRALRSVLLDGATTVDREAIRELMETQRVRSSWWSTT